MFYDRDSPAGKEYAIPLEDARSIGGRATGDAGAGPASSDTGRHPPSAQSGQSTETLFGEGVTAAGRETAERRAGRNGDEGRLEDTDLTGTVESVEREETAAPTRATVPQSGAVEIGGIAALIALLTAGVAAAVFRRRRRA